MPESLLTILKFFFLALLYLFFVRVVRAVWAEVSPPKAVTATTSGRGWRERGASRPARGAQCLRVVEPAEQRGRAYELHDELTLGRGAGCQVTLDDTYVSQLHARLFRKEGQVYV